MILGIGTDIIEVGRIGDIAQRHGDRFVRRIFTETEIAYCSARKNAAMHYAGRFAAKEAAFKAMGRGWGGEISWKDVEIINLPSGAPQIFFYGKALETVALLNMSRAFVTISHIEEYATAVVIIERD
jgi:holo-[acyl-carrier protein] synthase